MIDFFYSYRCVLVFSMAFCVIGTAGFIFKLTLAAPDNNTHPEILLLPGLLALYVGVVLKRLTERIETLESRNGPRG